MIKKSGYLIIIFLFFSCSFIDFGNDEVTCSPSSTEYSYNHEYVIASFNCEVDHYTAEQCLKIQSNGQPLELVFEWEDNNLLAKPETGWVNGRYYNFSVNGSVLKKNGSQFSVDYKCSFIYGSADQSFKIVDKSSEEQPLCVKDSIFFTFNHKISYVDFVNAFKLSPSEKINYTLSKDQTSVIISPDSQWKINTIYTWEIKDLVSIDNWELAGVNEGKFLTQVDIDKPELLNICPVSDASDSALWAENTDINGNISKKECIGFIFSKTMDFASIKSGISITPSMSGYFCQASNDCTKFLFVPLTEYEIKNKYLITISKTVSDANGNGLYKEIKKEFYSGDSFLSLSSIDIGANTYPIIPDEVTASTVYLDNSETLMVSFTFSKPIESEARYSVINNIALSLNFPMTSNSPILLSSKWDTYNQILTLTWGNITKSTSENSTYYDLKLNGGKAGISTGNGNYMEDSICIHIKISS